MDSYGKSRKKIFVWIQPGLFPSTFIQDCCGNQSSSYLLFEIWKLPSQIIKSLPFLSLYTSFVSAFSESGYFLFKFQLMHTKFVRFETISAGVIWVPSKVLGVCELSHAYYSVAHFKFTDASMHSGMCSGVLPEAPSCEGLNPCKRLVAGVNASCGSNKRVPSR